MNENNNCTPPEIREVADEAKKQLLPKKSKNRYESAYLKFMEWCKENKVNNYTENVLLAYFQSFQSNKSLWSAYSMLKSCLIIHNSIDISTYRKLIAFLKRQTENNKPKKSKVLTETEVNTFISEAPNEKFLLTKTILIMGISGACRREELCKMSIDDVEFKDDIILVDIPETKTNTSRKFAITRADWISLLKEYKNIRVKINSTNTRFFCTYRDGKCVNSASGINTIGKTPSKIAEYLNLDSPNDFFKASYYKPMS